MARILVIDDNEGYRQMVRQMLEMAGYEVVDAEDGAEGVKVFQAERPDLVITDVIMPEQEGIETIIGLRRLDADIQIIAMSGGGGIDADDLLSIAGKLGAQQILAKPFRRDQLLASVRQGLETKAA